MNIDGAYRRLTEVAYSEDYEAQCKWLGALSEVRKISVEYLIDRGCVFIPNASYVADCIGEECLSDNMMGFYLGGRPLWQLYYILPITNLVGNVVGIVGWDAYGKYQAGLRESGESNRSEAFLGSGFYRVSGKYVFRRDKYFLADVKLLNESYEAAPKGKRVVFVVDGVFDEVSLGEKGLPAICVLGSTVSNEVLYFLRFYDYVYVISDNDDAGLKLYESMKRAIPGVYRVIHNKTKDIEERLRSGDGVKERLQELVTIPFKGDVYLDAIRFKRWHLSD